VASFDLVRHHHANQSIFLYAFDLIELNGDDLRRDPLEVRKATLASIVAKARPGIRFNEQSDTELTSLSASILVHGKCRIDFIGCEWTDSACRR
jgi:ATP-dependent DNA ligase